MDDTVGQTVIVTGAGAGIGRALATGFVGRGAHVVGIGRSAAGLDETIALTKGPGTIECHVLDVADAIGLERLFASVVAARGGVDVLINNAAVYPRTHLRDVDPLTWSSDVATNLNGVVFGCRAALRTFPVDRLALVLNVGTFAYLGPESASTLYCTTKAGVNAFTRALAVELAATGSPLIVNEWVPGVFKTQMSRFTGEETGVAFARVLRVIEQSRQGPGGRLFSGDHEHLAPRSRLSRLKAMVLGR